MPQSERSPNGRSSSFLPTVVVTGSSGRLGQLLVRRLHRVARVIGLDRRALPGAPSDMTPLQLDIRRNQCEDVFRREQIHAVVHLGVMHDPRAGAEDHQTFNIVGTQQLLRYCAAYRVPRLVFLSSADVYGPRPTNPHFLTEEAPLLGAGSFSEIRDLIEVDMAVQSAFWRFPSVQTIVLRPSHILGRVRNAASNYLRLSRIPTVMGFDPMVQVIHEEDVVGAIELALHGGARGVYNLAGPLAVPLSTLVSLTSRPTLAVPYSVFSLAMRPMWKLRLTSFPAPELDHIRFTCLIDDTAARNTLGYAPRYSVEQAVDAALDRGVDGPALG